MKDLTEVVSVLTVSGDKEKRGAYKFELLTGKRL